MDLRSAGVTDAAGRTPIQRNLCALCDSVASVLNSSPPHPAAQAPPLLDLLQFLRRPQVGAVLGLLTDEGDDFLVDRFGGVFPLAADVG